MSTVKLNSSKSMTPSSNGSGSSNNKTPSIVLSVLVILTLWVLLRESNSEIPIPVHAKPQLSQLKTTATQCRSFPELELPASSFHAQGQVDEQLLRYLFEGRMCGGSYIEMGAIDGDELSNSWVFNKELQWKGVLIEGNPEKASKIPENRPNELAVINAGVCSEPQTLHYIHTRGSVNGFWEFAAKEFRNSFWKNLDWETETMEIQCQRMTDLLQQHLPYGGSGFHFFDFFSLDVEGAELEVLKSMDFSRLAFGLIVVENDGRNKKKDKQVRQLLQANGYVLQKQQPDDLPVPFEVNDFFLHEHFSIIYKEFLTSKQQQTHKQSLRRQ